MTKIKFGTDGWRAVIAEDFTFTNLERVAQATASFWKKTIAPHPAVAPIAVVGYDRRFLSGQFAQRTAEILAGNGFQVVLTSVPTPTPAVSLAVLEHKAVGGVMITASHNPAKFNGFKIKAHYGGSADPAICQAVEQRLDTTPIISMSWEQARLQKQIVVKDIRPRHYAAVKARIDFKRIAASRLRVAHDAMFGVGAGCFDDLLARTTCKVTTLNAIHDPFFGGINPEPIPQNYGISSRFLKSHPHDLCIVTDGDADRVGGMDGRGNALSTHQLICLLLQHLHGNRQLRGRVVKALTTTSMLDKLCADRGIELVETGVGFKYVCAEMLKGGVLLGAEESGGIGFPGHIPERDGVLAGMMLIELLAWEKKPFNKLLTALEKTYGPHRYARIDTHFPLDKRLALMEFCKNNPPSKLLRSPVADVKSFDGVKFIAADGSWLMVRGSGTEPVLRIYAEASTDEHAASLLKLGQRLTTQV